MRLIFERHSRRKILRTIKKLFLNSSLVAYFLCIDVRIKTATIDTLCVINVAALIQ